MSYVGNISDDPITDFMLDTLVQRGHSQEEVRAAYERWYEEDEDWEMPFYAKFVGAGIDAMENAITQGVPTNGQDLRGT